MTYNDDPSMHDVPRSEMDALYWQRQVHNNWMSQNDPNEWAWLMARDKRMEKYSEAIKGARKMREAGFIGWLAANSTRPTQYIHLHIYGKLATPIEIEYGMPTFKQNFFGLNKGK